MTKIALVDDEQSILTSVSLSLQSEGFTVDTFLNGVEALEALESKSYDLGLFDIKMPKMDGNELLSKVRSSKIENPKKILPIIFLTSKDHEQDEIIGIKNGKLQII
jgi:Response regulators consisting of a CheY-like receiver domain and a winged-helix DNA-binding domain